MANTCAAPLAAAGAPAPLKLLCLQIIPLCGLLFREYIRSSLAGEDARGNVTAQPLPPWYKLLQNKAFLGIIVGHTCHNYGWFVLLSWMPKYLSSQLGIPVDTLGAYAVVPYILMFAFDNMWSHVVEKWIANGMRTVTARKLSQVQSALFGVEPSSLSPDCCRRLCRDWAAVLTLRPSGGSVVKFLQSLAFLGPSVALIMLTVLDTDSFVCVHFASWHSRC